MTLSALIRKRDNGNPATAIPAIAATQPKEEAATVARIATVAVANPKEEKTAPPAKVGVGDMVAASRNWLIHYVDRNPLEVACSPEATHAQILECYPAAVAAEPFARLADEEPPEPDPFPDDRRRCLQCLNLRGRVCSIAKPGGLVSANRGYRPAPDTPQRCAGYLPNATDTIQQPGGERWSGLIQKGGK